LNRIFFPEIDVILRYIAKSATIRLAVVVLDKCSDLALNRRKSGLKAEASEDLEGRSSG
jgi:hypothetical protein